MEQSQSSQSLPASPSCISMTLAHNNFIGNSLTTMLFTCGQYSP
jgi:hypothetical protein